MAGVVSPCLVGLGEVCEPEADEGIVDNHEEG